MNPQRVHELARQLLDGHLDVEAFLGQASHWTMANVGAAHVDLDRQRRCGFPEVVYAEGKPVELIAQIFRAQLEHGHHVLATRVAVGPAQALAEIFPDGRYNAVGRTFTVDRRSPRDRDTHSDRGRVLIITAGSTDRPVAEEALETALWMDVEARLLQDLGVAGPQRLLAHLHELRDADAVVVVAGMEGALPSVVGGHVACPVVAVPTSVGYGASFGGLAALLGMLNSCASNVTVVNIDAGFKGAYIAGIIARNVAQARNMAHDRAAGGAIEP
ncbi:MAG: nickel pincer cofactor biosynthesis protein LarB [Pirellulales bacterium]|nr:nickel pincer cofactor biosynthesis protein LarB [Pirellulales bacterium]